MNIEFRWVCFAGDVRRLQIRTRRSEEDGFGPWGYIPEAIATVDASEVRAVDWDYGRWPARPH